MSMLMIQIKSPLSLGEGWGEAFYLIIKPRLMILYA